MATNNFKAFGIGAGANVTSQADYEALTALVTGFQSGKAASAQINKAIRQSSSMAAMLGQFINAAGLDALDNGNLSTLLASFTSALTANLSLGTASKKNVGTGFGQIPDMSSFAVGAGNNYYRFPNGMIVQVFGITPSTTVVDTAFTFPLKFPNGGVAVLACYNGGTTANFYSFNAVTTTGGNMRVFTGGSATPTTGGGTAAVIAIGY